MNEAEVRAWLLKYAWTGTEAEQAANIDCIMAQGSWRYIDARADQYAGAQNEPGPAAMDNGTQFALSELY